MFRVGRWTFERKALTRPSRFRAKSAHQKDNQADQQNQAKATAADGRPANIKTAAAEQEKKNNDKKEYIHDCKIALRGNGDYGALPYLFGEVGAKQARGERSEVRNQRPAVFSFARFAIFA
jgi:hypothetical protein